MITEQPRRPTEEMHCPACDILIPDEHPYSWCSKCGKPLPADIQGRLAKLQGVKKAAAEAEEARTVALEVGGRTVPCPICGHGRFWTMETVMSSRGAAFFDMEWASPAAVNYVCTHCGHVLWFLRK